MQPQCKDHSDSVELETEVGEALLEEPAAEVEERLADDGGMAGVEMSLLHLLELLSEQLVHEGGQLAGGVGLAEVIALELVEAGVGVEGELVEELDAVPADFALEVEQELAEDVVDGRGVGLVLVRLLLLLVLLPVVADGLQEDLLLLGGLPAALLGVLVLLGGGEELEEVLLQLFEVVGVLLPVGGFGVVVVLGVGGVVVVLVVGELGELGLAVVLGLDVGVEGGVAEVGFAAVAAEVAAVLVVARAPLALELLALVVVEPVALRPQVRFAHQNTHRIVQFELMLCFLGLRLAQPISDRQKYRDCLQEMRHYLTLRKTQVTESDHILTATHDAHSFSLPKNPLYLHTAFHSMPLFASHDYDFLDTCYECLLILQEAFPLHLTIQLLADEESPELTAFQERKDEELNRRINSNARTAAESTAELTPEDLQTTIFLLHHHYTRKNKALALKTLAAKLTPGNTADLPSESIELLGRLQEEGEFRKTAGELVARVRALQAEGQRQKENRMQNSNLTDKYGDTAKLQPLLFQLRESHSLERVCALLASALDAHHDRDYYARLESAVNAVTNRFIAGQFEEAGKFGSDFGELVKQFWGRRGKKWDEAMRSSLETKIRSGMGRDVQRGRGREVTVREEG